MKYCDVIIWPFHHKSFPVKNNTNRGIWQLKDINPLFWKRNFKIRHRSTPRYKMPFWYLIRVVQTHLHAKGFVVPMGGTIVYRTFSNYNELCTNNTFYHFFSKIVAVLRQKESCFQIVSIMYWQYILIYLECGNCIFRYYM